MKKLIFVLIAVAGCVFAANYNADTLESANQSNGGRVLVKYFSHNTGAVAHTNDTILLAKIPMQARIIGGVISVSAMGSTQTFDVGLMGADGSGYYKGTTANDVDLFLDGISCTTAINDTFADAMQADANANLELGDRHVYLTITHPTGTTWTTNETITGWVKFIEP